MAFSVTQQQMLVGATKETIEEKVQELSEMLNEREKQGYKEVFNYEF